MENVGDLGAWDLCFADRFAAFDRSDRSDFCGSDHFGDDPFGVCDGSGRCHHNGRIVYFRILLDIGSRFDGFFIFVGCRIDGVWGGDLGLSCDWLDHQSWLSGFVALGRQTLSEA